MSREWKWLGEDHITYAVRDIRLWRHFYVNVMGGREIHHTADVNPAGSSSMELYGIELGRSRIALVSPINRSAMSQVEFFLQKHGDSIQHVAYAISNLEAFVAEMKQKGFRFLGDIIERADAFGLVKQIFTKRFDAIATSAVNGVFLEFVERREKSGAAAANACDEVFSSDVANQFYKAVEAAGDTDDGESFVPKRGPRSS